MFTGSHCAVVLRSGGTPECFCSPQMQVRCYGRSSDLSFGYAFPSQTVAMGITVAHNAPELQQRELLPNYTAFPFNPLWDHLHCKGSFFNLRKVV